MISYLGIQSHAGKSERYAEKESGSEKESGHLFTLAVNPAEDYKNP